MKRASIIAVLLSLSLLLSAQSLWKEPKNPSWKTATGAEQCERLMWQSVKDKDWLAVESHMASNFVFMDAGGTQDKAQRLAKLKSQAVSATDLSDINVTPSGDHAIVTYTSSGTR